MKSALARRFGCWSVSLGSSLEQPPHPTSQVVQDEVGRWHQHQRDEAGEDDTERERHGHRQEEFGFEAALEHQRHEPEEGRQRRQENRSEPNDACLANRRVKIDVLRALPVRALFK